MWYPFSRHLEVSMAFFLRRIAVLYSIKPRMQPLVDLPFICLSFILGDIYVVKAYVVSTAYLRSKLPSKGTGHCMVNHPLTRTSWPFLSNLLLHYYHHGDLSCNHGNNLSLFNVKTLVPSWKSLLMSGVGGSQIRTLIISYLCWPRQNYSIVRWPPGPEAGKPLIGAINMAECQMSALQPIGDSGSIAKKGLPHSSNPLFSEPAVNFRLLKIVVQ